VFDAVMDDNSGRLDRADLARLYEQYGPMVFHRARRLLGDEALARDVCQDVFVQILRTTAWHPPSAVGWLCTTTTNACLNLLRGRRRWRDVVRGLPRPPLAPPTVPLRALLRGVPEPLQEIAIYYGIDRMSQDEIALVLGVSQKTVSNRIQELRLLLSEGELRGSLEAT
jgi:DNA-directed RNA polymerase specialized sigma24 family protein